MLARSIRQAEVQNHRSLRGATRNFTATALLLSKNPSQANRLDVSALLAQSTWSVRSLLPPTLTDDGAVSSSDSSTKITSQQLHHLLRLSALPPPKTPADEERMLSTLSSQLHFVREIQKVDTTNVEPLQSLHDESAAGRREAEINLESLKDALQKETVRGKYHKRIRRGKSVVSEERKVREEMTSSDVSETWDVLSHASKTVGRYFVVTAEKNG